MLLSMVSYKPVKMVHLTFSFGTRKHEDDDYRKGINWLCEHKDCTYRVVHENNFAILEVYLTEDKVEEFKTVVGCN